LGDASGDTSRDNRDILTALARPTGPAYVTLNASDVALLLASGLDRIFPSSAGSAQVAIDDDLLRLRAVVPLRELGGDAIPSLVGGLLTDRDTVEIGGTLEMLRPGIAQLRVRELRVRSIGIPPRLIPPLMRTLRGRSLRRDSLAADAVGVPLPKSVADVRVSRGRVTLYKSVSKP
jgi:hypothetical protein